jgi:hypothetical protein
MLGITPDLSIGGWHFDALLTAVDECPDQGHRLRAKAAIGEYLKAVTERDRLAAERAELRGALGRASGHMIKAHRFIVYGCLRDGNELQAAIIEIDNLLRRTEAGGKDGAA